MIQPHQVLAWCQMHGYSHNRSSSVFVGLVVLEMTFQQNGYQPTMVAVCLQRHPTYLYIYDRNPPSWCRMDMPNLHHHKVACWIFITPQSAFVVFLELNKVPWWCCLLKALFREPCRKIPRQIQISQTGLHHACGVVRKPEEFLVLWKNVQES
jgi:hypothetical protein